MSKESRVKQIIECEDVRVLVPKKIMKMLRDHIPDIDEFLQRSIVESVKACIDAGEFFDKSQLIEDYNLTPIFKEMNVT